MVAGAGRSVARPPPRHRLRAAGGRAVPAPDASPANISFGLPRRQRRDGGRVRELLALVGLDADLADRSPHQLSGGQQQRVALARALAPEPSLVLLDEPFSSLDAALREETRLAVADALTATGATAVLVTHDQAEALSMADQVAVLRGGRLVQLTDPRTLYRQPPRPRRRDVRRRGRRARRRRPRRPRRTARSARCALDGAAAPTAAPGCCCGPSSCGCPRPTATGPVARVRSVDFYGHDSRVWLDLPGGVTVSARLEGADLPAAGDDVAITVRGRRAAVPGRRRGRRSACRRARRWPARSRRATCRVADRAA